MRSSCAIYPYRRDTVLRVPTSVYRYNGTIGGKNDIRPGQTPPTINPIEGIRLFQGGCIFYNDMYVQQGMYFWKCDKQRDTTE